MRYRLFGLLIGSILTFGCIHPAMAQTTGLLPVRAKVGLFLPQGDVKNFAGSTGYDAEVDVALPSFLAGRTFLTAGYYHNSSHGQSLSMVPVTIGRYFSPPNPAQSVTGNIYFGLGAGAYFLRASAAGGSTSGTRLGAFGLVGYQFPNPYFVEAKYHVAGSINGISPHGLTLMVGRHF